MSAILRHWRWICVLGLVAGVGLNASGGGTPQPRLVVNGFTVLAGDFHVHGWPDGLPPWDAVREARRRRLDVIALTSHNSLRGWWLWQHAPVRPNDVMVLPGEELTAVGYHMAIVGIEHTIPWHQRAADAAAAAHAQHAVAILAHPTGGFHTLITDDDLRAVDGIEVAQPSKNEENDRRRRYVDVYRHANALRTVAAIGSSDFHYTAPIGICRTYVFAREPTPAGVLEAIRSARTVACDNFGRTEGPPALTAVVADRCRADSQAPPLDASWRARIGIALVWLTLAALVVLGPSPN